MSEFPVVSTVVFLPLLGVALLLFVPRSHEAVVKGLAFGLDED